MRVTRSAPSSAGLKPWTDAEILAVVSWCVERRGEPVAPETPGVPELAAKYGRPPGSVVRLYAEAAHLAHSLAPGRFAAPASAHGDEPRPAVQRALMVLGLTAALDRGRVIPAT